MFQDEDGRRCAVAHLLAASGHDSAVSRIRGRQNLARVRTISDPAVAPWASDHGLTIDELAEIQPGYSRGADPSMTMSTAILGATGLIACAVAFVAMFKRSKVWTSLSRVAAWVAFGSAIAVTVILETFDAGPCEFVCTYWVRPTFALPLMALLWALTGVLMAIRFWRWRSREGFAGSSGGTD